MAHAVTGTDWFLAAKVDRAEIYGEGLRDATWVGLSGLLTLFVAGTGFVLLRQREKLALAAVTQEAQAERLALQEQLARIAASVPGVIHSFRLGADGHASMPFTTVVVEDLFGVSQATLAEDVAAWAANVHPRDLPRVNARLAEAAAAFTAWHDQYRYLHPAKGLRWIEGWSIPKREADDSIVWHGFVMDVTERHVAEDSLRESEARYRSVVDNVKEVIFQTDAEGLWAFLNRAWTEVTGFSVEASLGRPFVDYIHADDRVRNQELFEPLVQRHKDHCRHEVRYLHRDGGFRWIEVFARLTVDADGEVVGTSGTLTDITERRAAEDALRQQSELLQGRNAELERFNRASVGRELDMIELKREVNALALELGREPPYSLAFGDSPGPLP